MYRYVYFNRFIDIIVAYYLEWLSRWVHIHVYRRIDMYRYYISIYIDIDSNQLMMIYIYIYIDKSILSQLISWCKHIEEHNNTYLVSSFAKKANRICTKTNIKDIDMYRSYINLYRDIVIKQLIYLYLHTYRYVCMHIDISILS